MKTLNVSILTVVLLSIANILFAQSPVKQYSGGKNGSVLNPSKAMGKEMSGNSTLKLNAPEQKNNYVYQNFVFEKSNTTERRVVFVIQANEQFSLNTEAMNLRFYTAATEKGVPDTLNVSEVEISKVNIGIGLYEFSFVPTKKFEVAGVVLQGGGIIQMAKIYKVYMAINNSKPAPFSLVTAKK